MTIRVLEFNDFPALKVRLVACHSAISFKAEELSMERLETKATISLNYSELFPAKRLITIPLESSISLSTQIFAMARLEL